MGKVVKVEDDENYQPVEIDSSDSEKEVEYMLDLVIDQNKPSSLSSDCLSTVKVAKVKMPELSVECLHKEKTSAADTTEKKPEEKLVTIKSEPPNLTSYPIVVAVASSIDSAGKKQEKSGLRIENVFHKVKGTHSDYVKKRERNLLPGEKNLFLRICANHPEIESKALDTDSLMRKRKMWEDIHREFTAFCPESSDRSIKFLKGCWKRLKCESRKTGEELLKSVSDGGLSLAPIPNVIYVLDQNAGPILDLPVSSSGTILDLPVSTPGTILDLPVSTSSNSEEKEVSTSDHSVSSITVDCSSQNNKHTSAVPVAETNTNLPSVKLLQKRALELAIEVEKERLEAHRYQKEAQRYAMMAEKERYETELLKKEAAKLNLKKERNYF